MSYRKFLHTEPAFGSVLGALALTRFYPTSYLIDADGRMRYVAYGPVDWDSDDIIRRIEALLPAGKAVRQATPD
jgi:hypothetical protein